ncbi:putative Ig domain-containing protein [Caulobacter sp.]|uniref:putative Ig domain-containing protein n=1 Tax=Caulobacter sp. TaxID=78 RepID=UPI0031D490A2
MLQSAGSATWRPILRAWMALLVTVVTLMAGPAMAAVKSVNGISLEINMPQAQRGVSYSFQLAPTGQTSPYTFQILSGSLPAAFTMSSGGLVTGVNCVSSNGSYPVSVRVTAANGQFADFTSNQAVSMNMTAGPASGCALTGGSISSGGSTPQVGQYYSATISASGGSAPYTYTVATGSLPTGLSLSTSGVLSGTPSSAGSFDFQIQSSDSVGNQGYTQYTLAVAAASSVVVSPSSLPTPLLNTAYSQTITGSGGTSPYTFAISAGSLPTGLSLNGSTGVISGTPNVAGAYSYTIRATDAGSQSNTRAYSGTIAAALAVTPTPLPVPVLNQAYSQTVTANGGTAPVTFSVSAGSLPTGLSLNSTTGAITGTPTASGAYSFTIQATDNNSATATQAYSGTIVAAVTITTATLPTPVLTQAYSQTLATSGGTAPVTFAISVGGLPAGLSLNASTGVINGTPTAAGAYSFTVRATDANNVTATQGYSGTISSGLVVSPSSLPTPALTQAYSQTITASGGSAPYAFTISAGSLPAGLSLNGSTGAITGTPTVAGAYSFTIQATDNNSATATQAYSGTIASGLQVSPSSLPTPVLTAAYSQTVTASGGSAPYVFTVSAGSLPAGLSLNGSTGAITGTPTASGAYSFTIQATDNSSATATQAYSGTIASGLQVSPSSLPTPVLTAAYSQTVTASGGSAPYVFTVSAGSLPAGLSLNGSTGAITGTPTASGAYSFTVQATDNNSATATQAYSGTIASGLQVSPSSLPTPALTQAYSQAITASGGSAPYAFTISAGSLPAGLSLNGSTGAITGTPTASGAYSFTVQATDNNSVTATQAYSGTITATLAITTTSLPTPIMGSSYSAAIGSSGGTAPIVYTLSGSLPAGLSLNGQTGAISGSPTASGAYNFTVQARDAQNVTASASYSGEVVAPLAATSGLSDATVGQPYAGSVGATGGQAPYSFSVSGLPPGLSVDAAGAVTGTPTTTGVYNVTIRVTDASAVSATEAVIITVVAAVTASDQSIDVSYNTPTTVTLASLNSGDTLDLQSQPAKGKISLVGPTVEYTPDTGYIGPDSLSFMIKGAWGQSRIATVKLNVLPPPPPTAEPPPAATLDTGATVGTGANGSAAIVVDKVNFNLASLVKGIVSDVRIATPPQHGKVELVRAAAISAMVARAEGRAAAAPTEAPAVPAVTAVYTADKGYVGRDSFTFVAIGPGGVSAPATVNIMVVKSTPTAPVLKAKVDGGRKITVDLTGAATDGPFLAATLVTTPAASIGAARLIEGGTATARTYALEFTSKGAFTGDVTFTYTLTNSSGVSDPLTVILSIEARQDPTTDATVRAVNDAQTETARRFAGTQMDNFGRRLESLHSGRTGDGFGLNLTSGVGQADDCKQRAHTPDDQRICREQAAQVDGKAGPVSGQRPIGKVEAWAGGAITVGRRDADTRLAKLSVQTSGVSGGADVRLSPAVTIGLGGGYASDVTKMSGGKGRVDAEGWTAATYASLHPASGVFIDALAGVGELRFNTRRTVAASGELVTGQRDAALRFGSLTAGYDGSARRATWSLYLRAKALDATLDAYSERGSNAYALAYDKRQLSSLVGVIGGRAQFDRDVGEVWITPRVRIEYSHEFAAIDPQRLRYADWLDGASYQLVGDAWAADRVTLGVGSGVGFDNGWSLDLDLGAELARNQLSGTARVGAAKRF